MHQSRGFGFIELLIVIATIAVLVALSYSTFFDTNRAQALEKDTARVASLLERARSLTLSSSAAEQYGVHLESARAVLFVSAVYDPSTTTSRTEDLSSLVTISSYALAGGGSNVVFERLTGSTAQAGTITLSLASDPSHTSTITIESTGLIETP